ncbi:hypothetical protein P3X46_012213 [Hevea brasiliensis]|uniref:Uncharacterized protein n=1 Tax=Hevea brasiliensis TaxID=3981 RepID=A0ABQ9MBP2_HEVBR|nr:probable terpene synthase 9 [Hevea brasiliensis]KAJ9176955.1 hypothetical protein P3X46_012213 [Hevea brasiliensis]
MKLASSPFSFALSTSITSPFSFALSTSIALINVPKKLMLPPRNPTINKPAHSSRFPNSFAISSKSNNVLQVNKRRRSAYYHPSIWDRNAIDSLNTSYTYDVHGTRLEELKHEVRSLLASTKDRCVQLKLIDSMQRLGVSYHFQEEIKGILSLIVDELGSINEDLYTTSLHFRLLREHAFPVNSDVFDKFRYENGKFKDNLVGDVQGLLSLYDASHLGLQGEDAIEEAKNFSTRHLKLWLGSLQSNNNILANQVQLSLDVPLHWRMPRIEARNFIDIYQMDNTKNLALLELAKLDYNLVQAAYQMELKELARWWTSLGFREKLHFSRDRLMENYLWAMGIIFEPQFSKCRIGLTKFVCILSAIDDMYDIYGSLDELELFTDAVNRWDTKAMQKLPEYMKICYFAMFNFGNELAFDVLKEEGLDVLSNIKEEWIKLCGSYLVEARWFARGYVPTLEEYLENAWISVGGHEAIVHASTLLGHTLSKDSLGCLKHGFKLIYWSSLITRLSDDLGTFTEESKRGDVTKSIQCYMIEEGVNEEEAKEHIKSLIGNAWKELNKESMKPFLSNSIVNMSLNMARTAQCIFQYGDGIGTSFGVTRDRLISLIVQSIPIN